MERKDSCPACAAKPSSLVSAAHTALRQLRQQLLSQDIATLAQEDCRLTVSQICSFICLPSMFIMRAPNSTPIVRSCTGWKRLSVNCSSRHDLPTPARRYGVIICERNRGLAHGFRSTNHAPVSPIMMYLKRYLHKHATQTSAEPGTAAGKGGSQTKQRGAHA